MTRTRLRGWHATQAVAITMELSRDFALMVERVQSKRIMTMRLLLHTDPTTFASHHRFCVFVEVTCGGPPASSRNQKSSKTTANKAVNELTGD